MSFVYRYGRNLYLNVTNRCPCSCVFCVRDSTPRLGDADSLWLDHEPSLDEIMAELKEYDLDSVREIVFCGYGEPTCRLDDIKEMAKAIKAETGKRIRLDTNGLGDLVNGRDIVPELAEVLDSISISLNASNAEEYKEVTRCRFGAEEAYSSLISFIKRAHASIPDVTVSVVGGSISPASEEACARMAENMGVSFRVR
ncbi:MAG: TatD family nuclease-associated radical SAM protein [archaeon]|nr:TatD family nuclease-associated radical SAM protein [archaeon]